MHSSDLKITLEKFKRNKTSIYTLNLNSTKNFFQEIINKKSIFILGNETKGVNHNIEYVSDIYLNIPIGKEM